MRISYGLHSYSDVIGLMHMAAISLSLSLSRSILLGYKNNSNLMLYTHYPLQIDNLHMQFAQYMWSNVALLKGLWKVELRCASNHVIVLYYKHHILHTWIEHWLKSTLASYYWFYYDKIWGESSKLRFIWYSDFQLHTFDAISMHLIQ